ncbi:MAG: hypothetical protein EOO40_08825, partial [Deltaproteobacteria bacterium]
MNTSNPAEIIYKSPVVPLALYMLGSRPMGTFFNFVRRLRPSQLAPVLACALLSCVEVSAVTSSHLAGMVQSEVGGAVPGATIRIASTGLAVQTDESGVYALDADSLPDPAVITVKAPGFATQTFRIAQTANTSSTSFTLLRPFDLSQQVTLPTGSGAPVQLHMQLLVHAT